MRLPILLSLALSVSGCRAQWSERITPGAEPESFNSAEFSIRWPPGYHLVSDDGRDSRLRVWRHAANEISADWGPASAIGWNPIRRWDGAVDWQRVDTLLAGRSAQLATYRLEPNVYALDAVWPDLGEHRWGGVLVTATLWVHAYTESVSSRDSVLSALGTLQFR